MPDLLPIGLPKSNSQHPRPRDSLPLRLPPQRSDILQPALPLRHRRLDASQTFPESFPLHGVVDSDDGFVLASRGTDDFGPAVVLKDEVVRVANRDLNRRYFDAWRWRRTDDIAVRRWT